MARHGWTQRQAASDALVAYGDSLRLFDSLMAMVRARAATNEGAVIVACSGNESDRDRNIRIATSLPAAAEGVISVGALGRKAGKQEVAFFSNASPLMSAPGVGILSATPGGGLGAKSGTSMACPHVAGVAALWWEHLRQRAPDGRASADEVITAMKASARRDGVFASPYSKYDFGLGLVTAPRADA
jgi:subtilisin family serine protease